MKNLAAVIASMLVVAACTSNDPVSPENIDMRIPGLGSKFTFITHELDPSSDTIAGTGVYSTFTIVADDVMYAGRTGVWILEEDAPGQTKDSIILRLDSNKDVLMYQHGSVDSDRWIRFPVTTGEKYVYTMTDTSSFERVTFTYTIDRVGNETVVVGAESVPTVKLQVSLKYQVTEAGAVTNEDTATVWWWYAPTIGAFVRKLRPLDQTGDITSEGMLEQLASYTLN